MKYYAVKRGKQPGIFETWAECKEQTSGFPGAVFKGFLDREQAAAYLAEDEPAEAPIDESLPFAYIDGSYRKEPPLYGYGGFLCDGEKVRIIQGTGSNPEYLPERNIAGEIMGVLDVVTLCQRLGIREINLFFDYSGIEQWARGNWRASKPLARHYITMLAELSEGLRIHFYQVAGHSGIEGNEIADYLAREAVGAKLRKKDIAALEDFRAEGIKERGTQWAHYLPD